jgi:hypothetical protein
LTICTSIVYGVIGLYKRWMEKKKRFLNLGELTPEDSARRRQCWEHWFAGKEKYWCGAHRGSSWKREGNRNRVLSCWQLWSQGMALFRVLLLTRLSIRRGSCSVSRGTNRSTTFSGVIRERTRGVELKGLTAEKECVSGISAAAERL